MKKIIMTGILIIPILFLNIPEYKELNDIIIVKEIEVKCINKEYLITLKEIIPKKEENGIEYEYKKYEEKGTNLNKIKNNLEKSTNKKFYYKKTKYLHTNCQNVKEIKKVFKIKTKD